MAVIRSFTEKSPNRTTKHSDTDATWCVIDDNGIRYLQIDTYGSKDREFGGKISQSIRLDKLGAEKLRDLLSKAFP